MLGCRAVRRARSSLAIALALVVVPFLAQRRAGAQAGAKPVASGSASSAVPSASVAPSASVSPSGSVTPEPEPEPPPAPEACPPVEGGSKLGVRYELESVRIRGNKRTLSRVILRHVPFRPGDEIDVEDQRLELTRYRLLGTGYFSHVEISLSKGPRRGVVILNIDVVERNTIVINDLWMGLSADASAEGKSRPLTAYGGVDFAENNFLGTGIALGGALAVADRQSAYRIRFVDPSFLGSKWIVGTTLLYNDGRDFFGTRDVRYEPPPGETETTDYAVLKYRRFGGEIALGYDLSTSVRFRGAFHLEGIDAEIPRAASHRRGLDIEPIDFHLLPNRSYLTFFSVELDHDTRDDPFLPTLGRHVEVGADFGVPTLASDYTFLRLQVHGSFWFPLGRGHVLRLDGFLGSAFGDAPFFMRFFVGDLSEFLPDRVLDLNFDRRPSPSLLRTNVVEMRYEELAARALAEYRIPLYRGTRSIYGIDLYGSAGFFVLGSRRDVTDPARGYSGFARVPIDLNFNLGVRISTNVGGFTLSLANSIGFLPIRTGATP